MRKVIKRQRTIVGQVQREVARKMTTLRQPVQEALAKTFDKAKRLVAQAASRKAVDNRAMLHSWYAPEVECILKGKSPKPYEFGVRVGPAMTLKSNRSWVPGTFPETRMTITRCTSKSSRAPT